MPLDPHELPDDVEALRAMLIAADKRAVDAEARASDLDAEIENLKLTIAKLQHHRFGSSSERARLLDQLELQLGELVEHRAQETTADEIAASSEDPRHSGAEATGQRSLRRMPARRPLPAHLPRERVMHVPPSTCPCCSGTRFRRLGADETESLERIPAQ